MEHTHSTIVEEVITAAKRIRPHILKTPLIASKVLSKLIDGKVFLKLESEQYTGSFKARGSLNKLLSLSEEEKKRGTVTASTGNHALGYARALEITRCNGTVYLPENASASKVKALKNYDVDIQFHGLDSLTTELYARQMAFNLNKTWVSPYNDPRVIGGQGTVAVELLEQLNAFDHVLVTVGGGGLISGVGAYLKQFKPEVKVIGCQPENSPEMDMSLKAGKIVNLSEAKETLSEGSAGGIEEGAITFPICQQVIDDTILVTEEEIATAIKFIAETHHKIIEGAAGVAVASLMRNRKKFKGSTVIIVICGANINLDTFKEIVSMNTTTPGADHGGNEVMDRV